MEMERETETEISNDGSEVMAVRARAPARASGA